MPIDKLAKILRLEAEKLGDRAVVGGLGRYATRWSEEATCALGPQARGWIEQVAGRLRGYGGLATTEARRRALADLFQLLELAPAPQVAPGGDQPVPTKLQAADTPRPTPGASGATKASGAPSGSGRGVSASRPVSHTGAAAREPLGLDSPITALQGIGPKQAERLARLGLQTIRDMLFFFPRQHVDYSQFKPIQRLEYGETVTIIARVVSASTQRTRKGAPLFKAVLSDTSGLIEATWFNQPFLARQIRPGQHLVISGKVDEYLGRLCFNSPQWEKLEEEQLHTARLVPIYRLTEGVHANWLRRQMKRTVDYWSKRLPDHLPSWVRTEAKLVNLETAIAQAHFPDNVDQLNRANYRLAFDELFVLQVGLQRQRRWWRSQPGRPLAVDEPTLEAFVGALPFGLTGAQQRALRAIVDDLRAQQPMSRLLQGDVGSGKTVVAAAAMVLAVGAGTQAAFMAPTEILAEQHYRTLSRLFESLPVRRPNVRLLTGSSGTQDREATITGLADGSVDIVVGTHALIQAGVEFKDLAFVVIDEQHRFGVRQRAALRQKGYNPHLLVMTATPIPRSLQLAVWGHMDVSVIDELPPGRKPITTRVVLPTGREQAYRFVEAQVRKGCQAFVICPLVEESENIEAKAAVDEHARLQREVFPNLRLGLLHGRMPSREKEHTMARFLRRELDILVSTSVVEVGVDVPNATVMLIEGANRFGLSQLHQFRGRVGRGEHPSYCLLFSDSSSPDSDERLKAIEATSDGFELAQKDLDMRGPGEFLGTRQSGFPELRFARIGDVRLVEAACAAARHLLDMDPELNHPDHRLLARQVAVAWSQPSESEWETGGGDVS